MQELRIVVDSTAFITAVDHAMTCARATGCKVTFTYDGQDHSFLPDNEPLGVFRAYTEGFEYKHRMAVDLLVNAQAEVNKLKSELDDVRETATELAAQLRHWQQHPCPKGHDALSNLVEAEAYELPELDNPHTEAWRDASCILKAENTALRDAATVVLRAMVAQYPKP